MFDIVDYIWLYMEPEFLARIGKEVSMVVRRKFAHERDRTTAQRVRSAT